MDKRYCLTWDRALIYNYLIFFGQKIIQISKHVHSRHRLSVFNTLIQSYLKLLTILFIDLMKFKFYTYDFYETLSYNNVKFSYHIRSDIFHLDIFAPFLQPLRNVMMYVILHYVLMLTVVLERELLQRL